LSFEWQRRKGILPHPVVSVDVKILAEKVRVVDGDLKLCFSSDSSTILDADWRPKVQPLARWDSRMINGVCDNTRHRRVGALPDDISTGSGNFDMIILSTPAESAV
jgi:hypothetical protein